MEGQTGLALDTLKIVKRLKEAGLEERQAEAIGEVLFETREFDLAQLATKADLALLRAEMRSEMHALRTELLGEMDRRFAAVEGEMHRRFAAVDARFAALEAEMDRRFAAVDAKLAVVQTELSMLKWMIGGVGFGLLLLIVRSFWPGAP
ncbi:MAG: hypothetical protein KatS3mg117_1415 [Geminicoccaceae bacterium]|nr:MAG: hypothetical protein KatS3mg117_1415 [Geminicoccaceae bacterium]